MRLKFPLGQGRSIGSRGVAWLVAYGGRLATVLRARPSSAVTRRVGWPGGVIALIIHLLFGNFQAAVFILDLVLHGYYSKYRLYLAICVVKSWPRHSPSDHPHPHPNGILHYIPAVRRHRQAPF